LNRNCLKRCQTILTPKSRTPEVATRAQNRATIQRTGAHVMATKVEDTIETDIPVMGTDRSAEIGRKSATTVDRTDTSVVSANNRNASADSTPGSATTVDPKAISVATATNPRKTGSRAAAAEAVVAAVVVAAAAVVAAERVATTAALSPT